MIEHENVIVKERNAIEMAIVIENKIAIQKRVIDIDNVVIIVIETNWALCQIIFCAP